MLHTPRALGGIVSAPHHAASQAGADVLRDGGTAVEAAVAVAATLAVVYPHMNGLGGDGFWLVAEPGRDPVAVEGCGRAAAAATPALYRDRGHASVPIRGPLAANTVAGAVSAWAAALALAPADPAARPALPLSRLLRDAVRHAADGIAPARSTVAAIAAKAPELRDISGFAAAFLPGGRPPDPWQPFRQPALARTLETLAAEGLDDFYRGRIAASLAADLLAAGSPVSAADLAAHRPATTVPLGARLPGVSLFNTRPPTQGAVSLLILSLFHRLGVSEPDGFAHLHGLVEATKRAFLFRDAHLEDPDRMARDAQLALDDPAFLDAEAATIDPARARPWPHATPGGDTVWFGAVDRRGQVVSALQSTFFEFGSAVTLPGTGITWQNRGASFGLAPGRNQMHPGARPFHTLNPAIARFDDGRVLGYGSMGGEGQPQFQAAVFTRYHRFGQELQQAVTAPRWLLGRTWGEHSTSLKLESRFDPALLDQLRAAGHRVEPVPPFTDLMGHAGAVLFHPSGILEAATDPRGDGCVAMP